MAQIHSTVGTTLGSTLPIALREQFDNNGDNSLFRPSVLAGLGLGGAALGARYLVNNGTISAPFLGTAAFRDLTTAFGLPALLGGLYSAFVPKGTAAFMLPSLAF